MSNTRTIKLNQKTETDIAILEVKVENIEQDVSEIKENIKILSESMNKKTEDTHQLLKGMSDAAATAHKALDAKISALEKWRWMMMGAGVVIGSLGFETLAKFLK